MKRRSFLQMGAIGGALAATTTLPGSKASASDLETENHFDLTIAPAMAEMIDGEMVYVLKYFRGLDEPSPELRVREGEPITITIRNEDSRPHSFWVFGVPDSNIGWIPPGQTRTTTFTAPTAGSYLYFDHYKEPLNRIMGLHGAFIVEPDDGDTANGSETPYSASQLNPQMQALFDAFGSTFPGDRWRASDLEREKLWLVTQIDPTLNARMESGENVDHRSVVSSFLPRYFTINGLSGFDTADHTGGDQHDGPTGRIEPSGREGEPCLLRCLNAGLACHALHIHGNHCFELADSDPNTGQILLSDNIYKHDTWLLHPKQTIDMLLPFERPPDVPAESWPPEEETFPLRYVMHCHFELSQTAAGGNYPQGMVTHWQMTGPR